MERWHTRHLLFGIFFLLCTLALSENSFSQQFDFRAVNLATGTTGIDVHFNDLAQASLSDLQFGDASKVLRGLPAVAGMFNVKYAASGDGVGAAFAGSDVSVQSGNEYTGVAYGGPGARKLTVLERSYAKQPLAGKVLVRILHAVNTSTAFDVYIGSATGLPLFSNIQQDKATDLLNITAEATALIITEAGQKTPLVQLTGPFGLGTPYVTLILTGTDKNNVQVYAHTFMGREEQNTQLILLEEASYANLRVVHMRPNAGVKDGDKLDVYFNRAVQADIKVTDTLKYRFTSRDYGPLFADSFRLKFVPPGESPTTSVLTVNQRLGNDTSYVMVLTQFQDLKPTILTLTRSPVNPLPPGLGSSRIRFANAAPFHTPITVVLTYGTDTMRFENVDFKTATEFRSITTGVAMSIDVYRAGQTEPFFSAGEAGLLVPAGSYLTVIASGNQQGFSVDMLNESLSGLHRLESFNSLTSVPFEGITQKYHLTSAPNPVSDRARLSFQLEQPNAIDIRLYDGMGRELGSVAQQHFEAGTVNVEVETSSLAPGMYTCVLHGGDGTVETTKIMVVR